jgi:hypothetical protein
MNMTGLAVYGLDKMGPMPDTRHGLGSLLWLSIAIPPFSRNPNLEFFIQFVSYGGYLSAHAQHRDSPCEGLKFDGGHVGSRCRRMLCQ